MRIFGKYMCLNCGERFRTGKFSNNDLDVYDDICPYCGALADETFLEWVRFGGIKVWFNNVKRRQNGKKK